MSIDTPAIELQPGQEIPGMPGVVVAPTAVVPAKPLTAIQLIEQELGNFFKQREQAVANVHAVEGAIQAAQHLLGKLKLEAAKAEAFVLAEIKKAETEVKKGIALVESKL